MPGTISPVRGLDAKGRRPPRKGNTAAHWSWEGIYKGLMQSGKIMTVGPNGQLLSARQKTSLHRHNSTTFYFAFECEGSIVIEGERLEWHRGDIFAVPAWKWHHLENSMDGDTILFSIDDWPAMTKLGFYRKEEATA